MTSSESDIEAAIGALNAADHGLLIVVTAIVRTHPRFEACQLEMTRVLEEQLSPEGGFSKTLSARQQDQVRFFVEWIGAMSKQPQGDSRTDAVLKKARGD